MKVKPEFKQPWLDALRSGDFIQGTGTLRDNGKHCCLGVLCEAARGHSPEIDVDIDHHFDTHSTVLRSGLTTSLFVIEEGARTTSDLAIINDHSGKTFSEIADLIEREM